MNTFAHIPAYPTAGVPRRRAAELRHALLRAPGLDLTAEPMIISRSGHRGGGATTCSPCSTCGATSLPSPASGPPERTRDTGPSPEKAGAARSRPASSGSSCRPLRLDHRPDADERPFGLSRGAQGPGGLQGDPAFPLGKAGRAGGGPGRPLGRHEDGPCRAGERPHDRPVLRARGRTDGGSIGRMTPTGPRSPA